VARRNNRRAASPALPPDGRSGPVIVGQPGQHRHAEPVADNGRVLRAFALVAVVLGLVALTAAACVLSYSDVHAFALSAGVSKSLARIYPAIADAALVVSGCAVLALRGAGLISRIYGWLCFVVLLAALAATSVMHVAALTMPSKAAEITAAVFPWAVVLIAFGLLLALLRHARRRRPSHRASAPAGTTAGQLDKAPPFGPPPGPSTPAPGLAPNPALASGQAGASAAAPLGSWPIAVPGSAGTGARAAGLGFAAPGAVALGGMTAGRTPTGGPPPGTPAGTGPPPGTPAGTGPPPGTPAGTGPPPGTPAGTGARPEILTAAGPLAESPPAADPRTSTAGRPLPGGAADPEPTVTPDWAATSTSAASPASPITSETYTTPETFPAADPFGLPASIAGPTSPAAPEWPPGFDEPASHPYGPSSYQAGAPGPNSPGPNSLSTGWPDLPIPQQPARHTGWPGEGAEPIPGEGLSDEATRDTAPNPIVAPAAGAAGAYGADRADRAAGAGRAGRAGRADDASGPSPTVPLQRPAPPTDEPPRLVARPAEMQLRVRGQRPPSAGPGVAEGDDSANQPLPAPAEADAHPAVLPPSGLPAGSHRADTVPPGEINAAPTPAVTTTHEATDAAGSGSVSADSSAPPTLDRPRSSPTPPTE
jgi:hypothetical protein